MSIPAMPDGYKDRFATNKRWERLLFRTRRYIQSPELNEVQLVFQDRVKRIADALFKDGDRVSGAEIILVISEDRTTAAATLTEGVVYLQGGMRDLTLASFAIPAVGTYKVGVRATQQVITELEDPTLRDPIQGTRAYGEKGAARLVYAYRWGWEGDGSTDDFFPVYTVVDGSVISATPPPQLDAVTEALARYDRDANGSYVVNGCGVRALGLSGGVQSFSIAEGVANVMGYKITRKASSRLVYVENPDIQTINAEPHVYADTDGNGNYVCATNHGPISAFTSATITVEKTVTLTHGGYNGVIDALPDTSISSIVLVKQGGTTYVQGTDYKLTSDQVDWSLSGQEMNPGSAYQVTYRFLKTIPGASLVFDRQSVTLSGGVVGSTVLLNYSWKLPRIDAIVMDKEGAITLYPGASSSYAAARPSVPTASLLLGYVVNNWGLTPTVLNEGVIVSLDKAEIRTMRQNINSLFDLVAQERLYRAVSSSMPVAKRGIVVDPFTDDSARDAGLPQTAAVIGGMLQLAINATVTDLLSPADDPASAVPGSGTTKFGWQLPYTVVPVISQEFATGSMKINPYQSFDILPGVMVLDPSVDAWSDYTTNISYGTASLIEYQGLGVYLTGGAALAEVAYRSALFGFQLPSITATVQNSYSTYSTQEIPFMRQREVNFSISGFAPNEELDTFTFDGIPVAVSAQ